MRLPVLLALIAAVSGCMMHHAAPMNPFSRPNFPAIDPNKLPEAGSVDAKAFQRYCSQCHNLPNPAMQTAAEWQIIVPRMVNNMRGAMMMVRTPSVQNELAILDYLQRHAQKPLDASAEGIDLKSAEGQLFEHTCSRCHALPSPKQHRRDEWPDTVKRMVQNMRNMGKSVPSNSELVTITRFLQNHAAD
jgi:cytochrome c5